MIASMERKGIGTGRGRTIASPEDATHNLSGQRLGRKGQETRERIIQAMQCMLDSEDRAPITLSAISRVAGMSMSSLYLYFPDLPDLLLAVLRRVADQHGPAFIEILATRWPDEALEERALVLVRNLFGFWHRHARLFQMRNSLADAHEARLVAYRFASTKPALDALAGQMDGPPGDIDCADCAAVLMTGLERLATIMVSPDFALATGITEADERRAHVDRLSRAQANIIAISIRDMRSRKGARP